MDSKVFFGYLWVERSINMADTLNFTIRLPVELATQVEKRATINRRSRNGEIVVLIEKAIDAAVLEDLKVLRSSSDLQGA